MTIERAVARAPRTYPLGRPVVAEPTPVRWGEEPDVPSPAAYRAGLVLALMGRSREALTITEISAQLGLPNIALPLYPAPDHCNSRGLTTLGEHTIQGLADRKMIFDPDHMSVKARSAALDQIDDRGAA